MPTVYLPAHVDRSSIRPCIVDERCRFVDIESEQQAIEQEEAEHQAAEQQKLNKSAFIVLEKDYFTIYNVSDGPLKCDYVSRNYLTMMMIYYMYNQDLRSHLEKRNGLIFNPEPTTIYFVPKNCTDMMFEDPSECNSVLVHYREKDVEKFAETTRAMGGCCNHFFVVYEDGIQQCFDANSIENNYIFSRGRMFEFLPAVRKDVSAIERFKEEDRLFEERQMFKRLPDGEFTLKDANGDAVHDGEEFSLVVVRDDLDDDDDVFYEYDEYSLELFEGEFMALPSPNKPFTCETIDDILYLKQGEEYLYCSPNDNDEDVIMATPELPERSDRLQIIYNGADILLARWDKSAFATCEWLSASSGSIVLDGNWYDSRFSAALRLRLVKTQRNSEA